MEVAYVKYHSERWELLVEMGFVTWTVDGDGIAKMIKERFR